MEKAKAACLFLRAIELPATCDIETEITLAVCWEKLEIFKKPTEVSQNTPIFISIGPPITK